MLLVRRQFHQTLANKRCLALVGTKQIDAREPPQSASSLSVCGLGPGLRSFAFITGHKATKRKNKKKRAAIERKRIKKLPKSLRPKQEHTKQREKRPPFYNTPTPSDYPLGPNYNPPEEDEVFVPPSLLSATSSSCVFVSTSACEEADLDPSSLYHDLPSKEQFCSQGYGPSGSFRYFSPQMLKYEYPKQSQPEVAFIGRSNVGKSSLINAIMRQKLALTSKQPGRTQQPYYYGWVDDSTPNQDLTTSSASAFIVDLPGYGYAVGPDRAIDSWQKSTQEYLLTRHRESKTLRRVFLLQDSRLGVPQSIDATVASWLDEAEIPYSIVLTKADNPRLAIKHANLILIRYEELMQSASEDDDTLCCLSPVVHVTSAKKETGLVELLSSVVTEFEASLDVG